MFAYMIQILKPKELVHPPNTAEQIDGFDKITIELISKETN